MSEWLTVSRRQLIVGASGPVLAGGMPSVGADIEGHIRWINSEVNNNASSVTVVNGGVYFTTLDSGIFACETSGEIRWSYEDTTEIYDTSPNVVDGVCYAKDNAGSLYALEVDSGELLWAIEEEFPGSSSPTVYKDRCYVCGGEMLSAVDTFTGEIEWRSSEILGPVGTGPTVSNDRCFVRAEGGVTAHDLETGAREWAFEKAEFAFEEGRSGKAVNWYPSGIVVSDSKVYAGSDHGTIYAIMADSGEEQWRWTSEEANYIATPTINGKYVCALGSVYISSRRPNNPRLSELIILERSIAQPNVITAEIIYGPNVVTPTMVEDKVIWPTSRTRLIVYSIDEKSTNYVDFYESSTSDPVLIDGEVYLGSTEGVMAVDTDVDGSSTDLRVEQGSSGHHDSWAEEASLEIESLDLVIEETTLGIGGETSTDLTVTFATGREEPVLERATLEITNPDVATVDADGTVRAVAAGETEIVVTYREVTEQIGLVVEGDDSMPVPGIVGTAVGIGSGAYILKRSRE